MANEMHPHPVQRAPAPWTMKAESYLLFLRLRELPKGLYDELEAAWGDEALGGFEGGLGAVMIVRYADTPVGRSCLVSSCDGLVASPFVRSRCCMGLAFGVQCVDVHGSMCDSSRLAVSLLLSSNVVMRCRGLEQDSTALKCFAYIGTARGEDGSGRRWSYGLWSSWIEADNIGLMTSQDLS